MLRSENRAQPSVHRAGLSGRVRWLLTLCILIVILMFATFIPGSPGGYLSAPGRQKHSAEASSLAFEQWGSDALALIGRDFRLADTNAYAEAKSSAGRYPAFLWSRSVHLAAVLAAAETQRDTYLPLARQYVESLRPYWQEQDGVAGYDVLPGPKPVDRYYDDNAWMVQSILDLYELSGDPQYLILGEETQRFVMSGEDANLGGGIYWREQVKDSKNTCSNAPAALGALRLYRLTRDPAYLADAERLYAWINARLEDNDNLYFDNMRLDGSVDRTKWSYNSAIMIKVNVELYALTGEQRYLDEAQAIARAAHDHWVDALTGAIVDEAPFAQHLADSFLALYRQTSDSYWLDVVRRAALFLHDRGTDPAGRVTRNWGAVQSGALGDSRLIDAASAARLYWLLARPAQPATVRRWHGFLWFEWE